jgi:hypothetical protein
MKMKKKIKKELKTYGIEVRCGNCGHYEVWEQPCGVTFKQEICPVCECYTLQKILT